MGLVRELSLEPVGVGGNDRLIMEVARLKPPFRAGRMSTRSMPVETKLPVDIVVLQRVSSKQEAQLDQVAESMP